MKRIGKVVAGVVLILLWLWALGASLFVLGDLGWLSLALFASASLVVLVRFRKRAWIFAIVSWLLALLWYATLTPRDDRDWVDDQARAPTAEIDGSKFTIHDFREFRYRSEDDYDIHYGSRTFDLDELTGIDLVMCHWGGLEAIGHTMLSFGFSDGRHLVLSVEARKEKGETYGVLPGWYRQFEIIYVLGDERDVVNVRTSFRKEDLYLFPLLGSADDARKYLRRVLARINELKANPEFYDTIDHNCTSALTRMSSQLWPERVIKGGLKALFNGYTAEHAHARGTIRNDMPFEELREKSYITPIGYEHRDDPEFSRRVREKLPRPKVVK